MKLHLIGICGTGMGSLAGLLAAAGHEVRGSDESVYPPMSTQLAEQGILVYHGYRPENLEWSPDRVVVGNVCSRNHPEVLAAAERRLEMASFPAILSELFLAERHSLVIAGTHGKTTTTSLVAHLLADAGLDPSFLVGGVPVNFGRSWRLGQGPFFAVEGDEYDTAFFDKGSKFLHYRPRTAILTSVELDHVDIFPSFDAVRAAFRTFLELIPADGRLLVCGTSPAAVEVSRGLACPVETYAVDAPADWTADSPETRGGRTVFVVRHRGDAVCVFESPLLGRHNLENTLGALAALLSLGLEPGKLAAGLRRFAGIRRRQEVRGVAQGVTVVDDFAHHPTAVAVTVRALRDACRRRLITVFEPRSASSRRRVFQEGFAAALALADEVVLAPLFAAEKIPEADRLDVERLVNDIRARGTPARVLPTVEAIVEHVADRAQSGDTVAVMSSGGFGGLHDKLLARLGDAVVPAAYTDLPLISYLLDQVGLPHDGVEQFLGDFVVIRDAEGGGLAGCVGLETYDDCAVLRSLAVRAERRGDGLGYLLADAALGRARERGARRVYCFTDTAADYCTRLGFRKVDRELVEPGVWASPEFTLSRSAGTQALRLDLDARR